MALSIEEAKKLAEEQGDSRKGGVNVKMGDKTVNMSYEDFAAGGGKLGNISGENKQVYTDPTGPSINIDAKNNKITIKAPQSLLDSQTFKDTYDSSTFKMLAKSYINSPENKLTLTDGTETTAAAEMQKYQDALSQMAEDRPKLDKVLSDLESYYGIEGATDQQAIIAASSINSESNNKAAVYLPAQTIGGFDFSQLESFDADNLTISKEDFDKFNQMRAFDDEHAKRTREAAQSALETLTHAKNDEAYEYDDNGREQAVRWISFYNSLAENKPKESAVAAVGNFLNFGIAKCGEVIFDMSDMIGKMADKIGDGIPDWNVTTNLSVEGIGKTFQILAATGDMFENMALNPQRFTGDQTWDGFSNLWTEVKDIMGVDISDEERTKAESLEADITNNTALRQTLSGGAAAGSVVGGLVGEIIKQTVLVNSVGGAVSSGVESGISALITSGRTAKTVSGLSKFAGLLGKYGSAEEIAAFGDIAFNLTRSSAILSTGESLLATGVGKLADIATQGIIDTLTQDTDAMRKLYENGDTSDIAEELTSNFIWNAIGEAGAFGGSKFISFLGETKFGQGVRLVSGKVTNEFGALKNQAELKLENMMGEWKGLKDNVGVGTRVFTEKIIEAQKEAAGAKTLKELQDAVKKRVDLENAFDSLLKGKSIEYALMNANPVLGEAISNYKASITNLSSAIVKSGDKIMPGSKVSQEVANYLSTKMHLSRALAGPSTTNTKWAKDLQARFDQLQSGLAGKGLLELANKNYDTLATLNKRLTDYGLKAHVISAEDIDSLRKTGYWGKEGESYFHTQRIKTGATDGTEEVTTSLEDYRKAVSDNSYREYHAKEAKRYELERFETLRDFVDPNVLMEGSIYQLATDIQGKKWGMALLNSSKVSKVLGGVESTRAEARAAKDLEKFRSDLLSNIKKKTGIDYQLSLDDMFPDVQVSKTTNAETLKTLQQQKAQASRAYDKAVDTYAGMQLDANDLAEIEVGIGGSHPIPNFDPGQTRKESFEEMVSGLDKKTTDLLQKQIESVVGEGANLNITNYRLAYNSIDDLDLLMRRSYVMNNTSIKKTKTYKDTIRRVKAENDNFRDAAFLDKYQKKYDSIVEKYEALKENPFNLKNGDESLVTNLRDMVKGTQQDLAGRIKETASGRNALQTFTAAGLDEETAVQYLVVDTMYRMSKEGTGEIRESVLNYLRNGSKGAYNDITDGDLKEFADIVQNMSDEVIESEWNTMTRSLIDNGHQDLVDIDEVFNKVEQHAQDILGKTKDSASHIIQTFGADGKLQFVETDPLTKDLYSWRPNYADSTPYLFFSLTNRVFKQFTSGLFAVKSLFTQGVKDPINTYVAGGAVPFLDRGMSRFFGGDAYAKISDTVVESLQERVIAALKLELGDDGWKVFERQAAEQGLDIGRAAVEYELITRPQAIAGVGGTETKFYQDISKARKIQNAYEFGGVVSDAEKGTRFSDKLEELLEKAENASPANARETYLRNVVYQEQFSQAISNGKSVSEARAIAERFMADATTNFSRPLAMGNRIARSIPYLSAAFNGKASFMRLLEIDPTGVAGRLLGGVILPYMSLLAESLGKEENREAYKNLTESDKADGLVFVTNGTKISIPMPEELSAFVSPFRQAIEKMADANDYSWTELALNDLLQLPVLDLTGYYELDGNELSNNVSFWDHLARGTEKLLFGQMSPAIVKSTYMAISGRDPYYGTEIDRSYVYDVGDGTVQTMDSNDNKIALAVSSWAKSVGINLSASAAYSIIGATFGKGLLNLGDSLASLLSGEPTSVGDSTVKGIVGTFWGDIRDRGADAWRSEVNAMYNEKEVLMKSDEYSKYVQAINNTQISEDKRQEYISNWRTYIQNYAERVVDTANKMKEKYGLTTAQQASVISLLTFSSNDTPTFNVSDRSKSQDLYYTARSLAIETLQQLGFTGSNDLSIFGYGSYVMNYETGEYEYKYKYNTPMAILDMGNIIWGQSEITLGNIKQLVEGSSGIKDDWDAFYAERSKLYDQASKETDKKKKNAIYDQVDDMNEKWSNRVMRAIVPYIDNYGLEGLLNNREVISYLEKYIQVPSNLMGDAKYMSQTKTGLDRNAGFAQSYIKKWYELYQKEKKKGN